MVLLVEREQRWKNQGKGGCPENDELDGAESRAR